MATSSGEGTAVDGQSQSVAAGEGTVVTISKAVKWDPFSSLDWDNEKHSKEALVRIKR